MDEKNKVAVIIITKGRKSALEKCIQSLLLPQDASVVIVANGYNKETFDYLLNLKNVMPKLECTYFEERISKSEARNIGIAKADSEIIYFLDDDSFPANGNLELLIGKFIQHPEVDIIGGPNITPPGSSMFERLAGYAFSEIFTAWKMNERFSKGHKEKTCDDASVTLCNLAFRKSIFIAENIYFDKRLYYNEENLLLERYMEKGHKILYCPELIVYHHRRESFPQLAEQIFRSGEGRAVMTRIMPESLKFVYILPFVFVIYLASFVLCGSALCVAPLLAYLALCVINAMSLIVRHNEKPVVFPLLLILPFVAHISYGAGFALGLVKKYDK